MPTAPNDAPSCCASVPDPIRDLPSGNDVAVTINLDNGDRGRPQKSGSASRDRKQPLWAGAEPAPKQGNIEPIGERQPGRRAASGLASHHRQSDRSPCEGSVKLSDRHRRSSPSGTLRARMKRPSAGSGTLWEAAGLRAAPSRSSRSRFP